MTITRSTTAKELKGFLRENGFSLNARKCTGTMKNYFIIGSKRSVDGYKRIDTAQLKSFLNLNFLGFEGKGFDEFSFNGGLSTLIRRY